MFIIFFIIFIFGNVCAQDDANIERLMTKRVLNCVDITLNSSQLIPDFYYENKMDSLVIVLNYWERKCGLCEPIMRIKILLSIYDDNFNENIYDENVIDYILAYNTEIYYSPWSENAYLNYVDESFNAFTHILASDLLKNNEEENLPTLFQKYYLQDNYPIFKELKSDLYNDTYLKRYYQNALAKTLDLGESNLGIITGYWIPTGKNKLLGNHPLLGFQVGLIRFRYMYNLTFAFRFLESKEKYQIRYKGDLIETSHFLSGYIGIDAGRELYRSLRHKMDLLGGIAFDGFDTIKSSKEKKGKSINSLNLNLGIGYKFYLADYGVKNIGIQIRYNFVNYKNANGTDLSGNTISLRLIYGFTGNRHKYSRLKTFHYYDK